MVKFNRDELIERLALAEITLEGKALEEYLAAPDRLEDLEFKPSLKEIPTGYKRCGRCGRIMKLVYFNKNKAARLFCTGNCKECQKTAAAQSYKKNKKKRNYKEYYKKNKERKLEHARKYYQENKEERTEKHKKYLQTAAGRAVMQKAHAKRRQALKERQGIPYTRELVIARDKGKGRFPLCYYCGKPIKDLEKDLHIDHVVAIAIGGFDCFTNVACTHMACNLEKKKDGRDITADVIFKLQEASEKFIENNPTKFK